MADITKSFRVNEGLILGDTVGIFTGPDDPTSGEEAGVGSLFLRFPVSGIGSLWEKTDTDDADWKEIGGNRNECQFIPVEWGEDAAAPPDESELITHTNCKIRVRQFDHASSEGILIPFEVPEDIVVASGIFFEVCGIITNATGPSTEGISFKLSGYSVGNDDDINDTFGDEIESKLTGISYAQYDRFKTTKSTKVTITNLARGELVNLYLYRDHDDTDDTYEQKIGVSGIKIHYSKERI